MRTHPSAGKGQPRSCAPVTPGHKAELKGEAPSLQKCFLVQIEHERLQLPTFGVYFLGQNLRIDLRKIPACLQVPCHNSR